MAQDELDRRASPRAATAPSPTADDLAKCRQMTKTNQIRAAWERGDKIAALRIASRFFDRSDDTKTFKRGWDAHQHPAFFRQIGKDPAVLVEQATALLANKFKLSV